MTPNEARERLLALYLQQDNLRHQLEQTTTELRDLRNYIAGYDSGVPPKAPDET